MPNTKIGTTWTPDIRPESIETFTETYTPEGGEQQTVEYKRVADHPILNGIRDIKAFFTTHVGAVWYNLAERKTLLTKLNELDAELREVNAKMHPIGSIYMSLDPTDPSLLFGGTWEQIEGRFLLAANNTYKPGGTGGAVSTRIQQASGAYGAQANSAMFAGRLLVGSTQNASYYNISTMPPYLSVYMWKRTA